MKTLEKRENCGQNGNDNEGVPTKLLISHLQFIMSFKTLYLIKANVIFLYYII